MRKSVQDVGGKPAHKIDRRSRLVSRFSWMGIFTALLMAFTIGAPSAQTVNYDMQTTSALRINLPASQALTVLMSNEIGKVVAADTKIADAQLITTKSIFVVGRTFGTTTVNIFDAEGQPVGLLSVEVGADVRDLATSIRQAIPASKVRADTVNGRVKLSGSVPDEVSMQKAIDIAAQYGGPGSSTP